MSVTIETMENSVRELLLDLKASNYRWSPAVIFRGLRDGIKRLNSLRPESRYFGMKLISVDFPSVDGQLTDETVEEVRATTVLIDERWIESVVYYATHKAYQLDNPDTANGDLSSKFLKLFEMIALS